MDATLLQRLTQEDVAQVASALEAPGMEETAAGLIGKLRASTPAPQFRVVRAPTMPPMPPDEAPDEAPLNPGATVVPIMRRRSMST